MEFRGRIYRLGILHFHKHDLARILIVFASDAPEKELSHREDYIRMQLACAATFKYKKFQSNNRAASSSWYKENRSSIIYYNLVI